MTSDGIAQARRSIEERWVQEHFPDDRPLEQRAAQAQRRTTLLVLGATLVLALGAAIASLMIGGSYQRPTGTERTVSLVLNGAGLIAILGSLIAMPGWQRTINRGGRPALIVVPRPARRELIRQSLGRIPTATEDVPFVRAIAERSVEQEQASRASIYPLLLGVLLELTAQSVVDISRLVVLGFFALAYAATLAFRLRRLRDARRYLARTVRR